MISIPDQWLNSGVLLAVSGGADSVALLRLFAEKQSANSMISVAHVNHGTRAAESDEDARFVRELSDRFQFPYFETRLSTEELEHAQSGSWEEAARELRYDFFCKMAEKLGYRYVATAHTQDDQAETILYRILRGTGIAGLAGIPPYRQLSEAITLVRPLLEIDKATLIEYLNELKQDFRTDSSNASTCFMRNKIRNHLLPVLKNEYGFYIDSSLIRLGKQAKAWCDYFIQEAEVLFDQTVVMNSQTCSAEIHASEIAHLSELLIAEVLKLLWKKMNWPLQNMGFEQWNFLAKTIAGNISLKKMFPGTIMVEYDATTKITSFRHVS